MSKQMIHDLKPGDSVCAPFVVNSKSLVPFRNKPGAYLSLLLGDRSGTIAARAWDDAEAIAEQIAVGDVVTVSGRVDEYRGTPQLIVEYARACTESDYDKADFLAVGKHDPAQLLERVGEFIALVKGAHLRALLEHFFSDPAFVEAFSNAPGAKALHHSHIGGLLEHTVGVVRILLTVAECHPELDRDLLIAGGLLHDIGKLRELHVDVGIDYTDTGRLVGHIVHTDRMVTRAIEQSDGFPEELADRLCHVLLSHHGQKEYGAPIVPMTPEACALHYADNLDAHVQYFQQVIDQGAGSGNHWSEYQRLFDRYIYIGNSSEAND